MTALNDRKTGGNVMGKKKKEFAAFEGFTGSKKQAPAAQVNTKGNVKSVTRNMKVSSKGR